MDGGLARAEDVMSSQRATVGCGWLKRLNDYEQRPREAPFLFVTFSLGEQRESLSDKIKIINRPEPSRNVEKFLPAPLDSVDAKKFS